jgi:hypothetical protein
MEYLLSVIRLHLQPRFRSDPVGNLWSAKLLSASALYAFMTYTLFIREQKPHIHFDIFKAAKMHTAVFLTVTLSSLVGRHQNILHPSPGSLLVIKIQPILNPLWIVSSPPPKLKSVALVLERTILTERPPIVGDVSANFC